jgi:6-phosphogluconolactonase
VKAEVEMLRPDQTKLKLRRQSMLRKLLVVAMALAISLAGTVPVFAQASEAPGTAGAVYIMDNDPSGNQVLAYDRASDGSLTFLGSFATGGLGSGVGVTVGADPLGSQNSLIVSPDGKWVFAVNAGSNEISSLKVVPGGLSLADKVSSGGSYPVSLTYGDGLLYVLNAAGQGNITGFKVTKDGLLKPLKGSTRSLDAATPADGSQPQILESPAQVKFSPNGKFLVVTDKGGVSGKGLIDVFKVSDGLPAASPAITQTENPVPFALTFDPFGHLVVVDAAAGTVTAYMILGNGGLLTNSVALTSQAATCWIASNGTYLYTDNTGSGTISGFDPSPSGNLAPLTADSIVAHTGAAPLDMGISRDGKYLYSLETGAGVIGIFMINADGSLVSLGTAGSFAPVSGFQGIAVR